MADCGASGTALDRVVAAAAGPRDSKQAVAALLGHASVGGTLQGSMPAAAPTTLVAPAAKTGVIVSYPSQHQHPSQRQPQVHQQQAPVMMHPSVAHQQHARVAMMHQQQHQQHAAMMHQQQQFQMMQHQMQQLQLMQQQQKVAAQKQKQQQSVQEDETTQQTSNINKWQEELEDELQDELARGATIEELSAAWAQAEAEYNAEYNADYQDADFVWKSEPCETYSNIAAAHQQEEVLHPYEFQHTEAPPTTNKDWLKEAEAKFAQGHVREAIQYCETELQHVHPDNAKAWYLLGKCHAEQDEDRKAIACLERSVERDPYNPDALLALGVCLVNELNHGRALFHLKNWMTHHPKYAGLQVAEEDVYGDSSSSSKNNFEQAQGLLLLALQHDPTDASVHQALGVVYNVSRDYDAAAASFRKAIELSPNDYALYNKLGATLANANLSEQALPAYQEALSRRPKYARAWLNLAISHSNLKNYDEAARCYLQTLSLNPSATHCWSYLRIALSCLEKWDLIPLAAAQDLEAFAEHYDFVQY